MKLRFYRDDFIFYRLFGIIGYNYIEPFWDAPKRDTVKECMLDLYSSYSSSSLIKKWKANNNYAHTYPTAQ